MNEEIANGEVKLCGLRGAITSEANSTEAIAKAVSELVNELVFRNELSADRIVSVTFSVTPDLNACFPAAIARRQPGWEEIALLDCQQMAVIGDLKHCIRILALAWLPNQRTPHHPYLGEALSLRPDRSTNNQE